MWLFNYILTLFLAFSSRSTISQSTKEDVVEGNNCYNYALNYQVEYSPTDPGSMAEFSTLKTLLADQSRYEAYYYAGFFFLAVRADSYYGKPKEFGFVFNEIDRDDELIGDDRYRVALAFGRSVCSDELDYHWYRQNKDGTWSHKPGKGAVRNFDLDGNPIMDPHYCNRRTNKYIVSDVNGGWESEYLSKVSYYTVKWNTEEYEYEEGYIDSDWLSRLGSNEL